MKAATATTSTRRRSAEAALPPGPGTAGAGGADESGDDDAGSRGPGRPRDQRASRAIDRAALRQLDEVGFAKLSMESVASEAGVARATVYRRYRDKADLVTAAIASEVITAHGAPPSDHPRRDLVRFLVDFDERFAESCLEVVGALLAAREEPHAMALHRERVVRPRTAQARRLLLRAQELGELDPGADVALALEMLAGVVFGRRVSGIASEPGWAERAVATIWRGMGPGTATGRQPPAARPVPS